MSCLPIPLELEHRPQSEYGGVFQDLAWIGAQRIGGAAAGMGDVLKVRLQAPAGADLILIDHRHQRLETAGRPARPVDLLEIDVKRPRPGRDPRIAGGNAEFIVGALVAQSDPFNAGVGVEIDQIAVRRAVRGASKNPDAAIGVLADAVEFLFENRVDTEIAGQRGGNPVGRHAGQRTPGSAEALVGKVAKMAPAAKLELSGKARIALFGMPKKLHLPQRQGWIVDAEVEPVAIA